MIDKSLRYAIVGASNNTEKYGYRVMKDMIEGGYNVTPINLKEKEILDQTVYSTLSDMPHKPDVVIMIVPPKITLSILEEIKRLKIENVWMQPGSESDQAIEFCTKNNINCVHHACIMIEIKKI